MLGIDFENEVQVRGSSKERAIETDVWPNLSNGIKVGQYLRNDRAENVHVVSARFHVGVQGAPQKTSIFLTL